MINYEGESRCFNAWRNLLDGMLPSITYSKGYKEYEEWYEDCKDDELFKKYFERVEEDKGGYTLVIIRRKNEES